MTLPDTAPAPARTALRLLTVPPHDPPYDDELPPRGPGLQLLPTVPPPVLRVVPPAVAAVAPVAPVTVAAPADPDAEPDARTPSHELPPARPFAHALVQRLLEVCAGVRPLGQLQRDTTPELYAEIEQRLRHRPRVTGARPTSADVRSVHVQQRPEGVAEVCATVVRRGRAGALALRVEGRHGRWVCSAAAGV